MSSDDRGSVTVAAAALMAVLILLAWGVASVGALLAARAQAAVAADAAALAAAPLTLGGGQPIEEARRLARANHSELVSCSCGRQPSFSPRSVEVIIEKPLSLPVVGTVRVRATSRAEFVPLLFYGSAVSPGLELSPAARRDVGEGRIDRRLLTLLGLLAEEHSLRIDVLQTGHSRYVRGTTVVSEHANGRAADISMVDGRPVSSANRAARRVVERLAGLAPPLRPDEVGSPFREFAPLPGFFTDADHVGHLHIAYGP